MKLSDSFLHFYSDDDSGDAAGATGNDAGINDSTVSGTQDSSNTDTNDSGSGGGGSFDWSTWDGSPDSVPEDQKHVYEAVYSRISSSAEETIRKALAEKVRAKLGGSDQQVDVQAKIKQLSENEGITREQLAEEIRRIQAEAERSRRAQDFRDRYISMIEKPVVVGDATIAFTSEEDVNAFEKYMTEKLNGGITPEDLLKLHRFDSIIEAAKQAAVRDFEKKLKKSSGGTRASDNSGKVVKSRVAPQEVDDSSLEEIIKKKHPDFYRKIASGEVSLGDLL